MTTDKLRLNIVAIYLITTILIGFVPIGMLAINCAKIIPPPNIDLFFWGLAIETRFLCLSLLVGAIIGSTTSLINNRLKKYLK